MLIPIITFAVVTIGSLAVAAFVLRRRDWCVLDPTVLFWLGFAVYYGVANLWFCWVVSSEGLYNQGGVVFDPRTTSDVESLTMVAGLAVVYGAAVAFGMFALGSVAARVRAAPLVLAVSRGPDIAMGLLVPLCVVHWILQFGLASRIGVQLPSAILGVPLVCCLALNLKLAHEAARHPVGRRVVIALGVLGISMLGGALGGMKQDLLLPAFAAFAGLVLRVRRPWPIVIAIAAALPGFLALKAWNDLNRSVLWDRSVKRSTLDRVAALGDTAREVIEADESQPFMEGMGRLCTAGPMLQTLELVRQRDGISFMDGLVIPYVPRVLWPGKPRIVVSGTLYERFSGYEGSSSSPGQPAEAFMYGGWTAVVAIGCALGVLGAAAGTIVRHLWRTRKAASLGAFVLVAMHFGKCENWFYGYLPSLLNGIVILMGLRLLTLWLSRRDRPGFPDNPAHGRMVATND